MKVIAMLERSAGNAETGQAWTETASFDHTATLEDVLAWAVRISHGVYGSDWVEVEKLTDRLSLNIDQNCGEVLYVEKDVSETKQGGEL